jgi:hypothetical protein
MRPSFKGSAPFQENPFNEYTKSVLHFLGESGHPNAVLKFKEFEMNHKVEIQKLILEEEKDVPSGPGGRQKPAGREREGDRKAGHQPVRSRLDGRRPLFRPCRVAQLIFVVLPESNVGPVNQLFGAMATRFGMVFQYFFGSSKGSADKTAAMMEFKTLAATLRKKSIAHESDLKLWGT